MDENKLNLNGEFLGITSLAIYSAPWFLQVLLLLIIGAVFFYKVSDYSGNLVKYIENSYHNVMDNKEQFEAKIAEYKRKFLGFNVMKENLPSYWAGFALYFVTLVYAIIFSVKELMGIVF